MSYEATMDLDMRVVTFTLGDEVKVVPFPEGLDAEGLADWVMGTLVLEESLAK